MDTIELLEKIFKDQTELNYSNHLLKYKNWQPSELQEGEHISTHSKCLRSRVGYKEAEASQADGLIDVKFFEPGNGFVKDARENFEKESIFFEKALQLN